MRIDMRHICAHTHTKYHSAVKLAASPGACAGWRREQQPPPTEVGSQVPGKPPGQTQEQHQPEGSSTPNSHTESQSVRD